MQSIVEQIQTTTVEQSIGHRRRTVQYKAGTDIQHGYERFYIRVREYEQMESEALFDSGVMQWEKMFEDGVLTSSLELVNGVYNCKDFYFSGNIGSTYTITSNLNNKFGLETHYYESDQQIKATILRDQNGLINGDVCLYNTEGILTVKYEVLDNQITQQTKYLNGLDSGITTVLSGFHTFDFELFHFDQDIEHLIYNQQDEDDFYEQSWETVHQVSYNSGEDSSPIGLAGLSEIGIDVDQCYICLDSCTSSGIQTRCGHTFCQQCIQQWVNQHYNDNCPTCRQIL